MKKSWRLMVLSVWIILLMIIFPFKGNTQASLTFPNPVTLSTGQGAPGTIDPLWLASPWYTSNPPNPIGLTYISTLINNNCAPGSWIDPASLPAPVNNGNWITGSDNDCANNYDWGYRYFRLTLNLPPDCNGYSVTVPGNYVLNLIGYVDNSIADVFVNGTSTGISGGGFSAGSQLNISLNGPWVAGVNYVDVLVFNAYNGNNANPYGLLLVADASTLSGTDTDNDGISNLYDLCPCDAGNNPYGCTDPSLHNCDFDSIRNAFAAAGCIELPTCSSDCSVYFLNPQYMTGPDAQTFAQNLGANLISIQSQSENECILSALDDAGYSSTSDVIWIGFGDAVTEGTFTWYDQSAVTYTNWAPGEPNNSGDEDCVQIYPGGANPGTWNDLACSGYNSMSIIEVNLCPVVSAGTDLFTCQGTAVTITAQNTVLGSSPYVYSWSNGAATQATTVSPAVTTDYELEVTDRYNCVSYDTMRVNVNETPVALFSADSVCLGTANSFSDLSTVSGTNTITQWSWDFGDGNTSSVQNPTHQYTAAGTYSVQLVVTASDGCSHDTTLNVLVYALPSVNAGTDQTACAGQTVTLSGSGNAVSYTWNNAVSNGVSFIPASTLTYTVTGTSTEGCVNTDQVDVTVNMLPVVYAGNDQDTCQGIAVTLTATGDAASYSWNNNVSNGIAFTPAIGSLIYTVTGTSALGCIDSDQVVVTVYALPTVNAGADQVVCSGSIVTLTATGNATAYSWDNGVTDGVSFTPANGTVTYTVTGTSLQGCTNTDQADVTVNDLPSVSGGTDVVVCETTSVTLSATGNATSYSWDNGITDGISFVPAVGTTTYIVTGTSGQGCFDTDTVDVTVNALPVVSAGNDLAICEDSSVALTGSGNAVTYSWNNNINDGVTFTPTVGTTTYIVTGTSTAGCTASDSMSLLVNPKPQVDAGADVAVCSGNTVVLTATGAVTYSWNNGVTNGVGFVPAVGVLTYAVTGTSTEGCSQMDSVLITVYALPVVSAGNDVVQCEDVNLILSASGNAVNYTWNHGAINNSSFVPTVGTIVYTVTGTSAEGCLASDSMQLTVNPNPDVNAGNDTVLCDNDVFTWNATGAATYNWQNGQVNGTTDVMTVGTWVEMVTGYFPTGCMNFDVLTIQVNPNPELVTSDVEICYGESAQLLATGAVDYNWNNGVENGEYFYPQQTATYTVTGTNNFGCESSALSTITVYPLPQASFYADPDVLLLGTPATTFVNTTSGASTYYWNFGDGGSSSETNPYHEFQVENSSTMITLLTAYSDFGCKDTANRIVQINDEVIFYVPNAFTPDGDELNQTFKPVIYSGIDPYTYTFQVFNRWGELIFESHDPSEGWDGSYAQKGLVESGTYIWKIEFKVRNNDDKEVHHGHFSLLK